MPPLREYYTILEVPENASREDIQASYRRLAKKYHPDVNKANNAHEKFCRITEAYEYVMNHWSDPMQQTPVAEAADLAEQFRKEARERAQRLARMRYEKFRQQHEAFQETGINDLALLLKIAMRLIGIVLFLLFSLVPFYAAIRYGWISLLVIFVTWPFATIIGWFIYDNRKNYLTPGKLYYSPDRIRHMFTDTHQTSEKCFYCASHSANSIPFKIELFRLKDIILTSGGFRQNNVHYQNKRITFIIPRSQKAFVMHSASTFIRVLSVILSLFLFPVTSIVWRLILGMMLGGLLSSLVMFLTRTISKTGYLMTYGLSIRLSLWIIFISLVSRFYWHPFNITTTDSIQFVVTSIVIFDCLLMQLLDMIPRNFASRTLGKQPAEVKQCIQSGYHIYNDIPVISVIYPLIKWFAG